MILAIYKRGQGFYTRLCSAFGGATIVGFGCYRLYEKLYGAGLGLWVAIMVPFGLFVVLGLVILWLVNKRSIADFMMTAEGEMKKVSWSSRKEIAVSTSIVVVVVIIMAVLLGITDLSFQLVFDWLL